MGAGAPKPAETSAFLPKGAHQPEIRSHEALAFLSVLIALADVPQQRALHELLLQESACLDPKLQRWKQALNDLAVPFEGAQSPIWRRRARVEQDIDEMNALIWSLRQAENPSGLAHFLLLIHALSADMAGLSLVLESVRVLSNSHKLYGLFASCPDQLSLMMDDIDQSIDCIYYGVVRALAKHNPQAPPRRH